MNKDEKDGHRKAIPKWNMQISRMEKTLVRGNGLEGKQEKAELTDQMERERGRILMKIDEKCSID